MKRSHKHQTITLILVLGVVAFVAQLAGVGGPRTTSRSSATKVLAVMSSASVPDIGSTHLGSRKISARTDETLRLHAVMSVRVHTLAKGKVAQVVCGIRYARDKDPAWTLGTPSKTIVLHKAGASKRIVIDRTIAAPANDTYRAAAVCHVLAPGKGARVTATGLMKIARGLPRGAATPA